MGAQLSHTCTTRRYNIQKKKKKFLFFNTEKLKIKITYIKRK